MMFASISNALSDLPPVVSNRTALWTATALGSSSPIAAAGTSIQLQPFSPNATTSVSDTIESLRGAALPNLPPTAVADLTMAHVAAVYISDCRCAWSAAPVTATVVGAAPTSVNVSVDVELLFDRAAYSSRWASLVPAGSKGNGTLIDFVSASPLGETMSKDSLTLSFAGSMSPSATEAAGGSLTLVSGTGAAPVLAALLVGPATVSEFVTALSSTSIRMNVTATVGAAVPDAATIVLACDMRHALDYLPLSGVGITGFPVRGADDAALLRPFAEATAGSCTSGLATLEQSAAAVLQTTPPQPPPPVPTGSGPLVDPIAPPQTPSVAGTWLTTDAQAPMPLPGALINATFGPSILHGAAIWTLMQSALLRRDVARTAPFWLGATRRGATLSVLDRSSSSTASIAGHALLADSGASYDNQPPLSVLSTAEDFENRVRFVVAIGADPSGIEPAVVVADFSMWNFSTAADGSGISLGVAGSDRARSLCLVEYPSPLLGYRRTLSFGLQASSPTSTTSVTPTSTLTTTSTATTSVASTTTSGGTASPTLTMSTTVTTTTTTTVSQQQIDFQVQPSTTTAPGRVNPLTTPAPLPPLLASFVDPDTGKMVPADKYFIIPIERINTDEFYSKKTATVTVVLLNDTWAPLAQLSVLLQSASSAHDEPNGYNANRDEIIITYATQGSMLNLTFAYSKCFNPASNEILTLTFANGSTTSGSPVFPLTGVEILVESDLRSSDSFSALVVSGVTLGALFLAFMLDAWCQTLVTLHQLQCLVTVTFSTCGPSQPRSMFRSSQWVLFPLSERLGTAYNPGTDGPMSFNFGVVFAVAFIQLVALLLFRTFGGLSWKGSFARVRCPSATIFTALALMPGATYAAVWSLSLRQTGVNLLTNRELSLSLGTLVFETIVVLSCVVILFRVVSNLIFREGQGTTFLRQVLWGGQWTCDEEVGALGVLFDDLHGGSFWFLGAHVLLTGVLVVLAAFTPGQRASCLRQYYAILCVSAAATVIVFLRRPFKSAVTNIANVVVYGMISVVCISMASASTCSQKGAIFASTAVWLTLVATMGKAMLVVLTSGVRLAMDFFNKAQHQDASTSRSSALPKRHTLMPGDRHEGIAVSLLPLNEGAGVGGTTSAVVGYKPTIPVPIHLGACIVHREIGFGERGGVDGREGPSVALQLGEPSAICCDSTSVFIVDTAHSRVLRHSLDSRRVVTVYDGMAPDAVAGIGGGASGAAGGKIVDALAADATSAPRGSQQDSATGRLFAADAFAPLNHPRGICIGQGCVYVADTENDLVRRIELTTGASQVVLGQACGNMSLCRPFALAISGNALYVSDSLKHRVVALDLLTQKARTIIGTGYAGYDSTSVPAIAARLNSPQGIRADDVNGDVYIADTGNHRVICYNTITQDVTPIIGIPGVAGETPTHSQSVLATNVTLCLPTDVAVSYTSRGGGTMTARKARSVAASAWDPASPFSDSEGTGRDIFVVDGGNAKIWRINRLGFAHVILPASDSVIPRFIAVLPSARKGMRRRLPGTPLGGSGRRSGTAGAEGTALGGKQRQGKRHSNGIASVDTSTTIPSDAASVAENGTHDAATRRRRRSPSRSTQPGFSSSDDDDEDDEDGPQQDDHDSGSNGLLINPSTSAPRGVGTGAVAAASDSKLWYQQQAQDLLSSVSSSSDLDDVRVLVSDPTNRVVLMVRVPSTSGVNHHRLRMAGRGPATQWADDDVSKGILLTPSPYATMNPLTTPSASTRAATPRSVVYRQDVIDQMRASTSLRLEVEQPDEMATPEYDFAGTDHAAPHQNPLRPAAVKVAGPYWDYHERAGGPEL